LTELNAPLLTLNQLRKSFGGTQVLRGVDLSLNSGDVYGFLGRNGAGKSTTIRIIMGMFKADSGELSLFGEESDAGLRRARQRVGYVAQEQHFYPWMTPKTLGDFVSGFYPGWSGTRFVDLLKRFELPSDQKVGGFSGGMKARLALCVAIATQPELLVLDEPTAGMDPVARREFLELVNTHAISSGSAVLFSTHVLEDIQAVSTRIGILEHGEIQYDGTLSHLEQHVRRYRFERTPGDELALPSRPMFEEAPDVQVLHSKTLDNAVEVDIRFPGHLDREPWPSPGWRRLEMTLEDRFIAMVSRQW